MKMPRWEDPESIVEGCIQEQSKILSGYKGNPKVDPLKYQESMTPKHVAISLSGEPTLYSPLGDLIECFHKRDYTTFLVTNGTVPEALSRLGKDPTQLYVSVCGSDKATFRRTCRPKTTLSWEKLNETLSLLPSFKCPTVVRLTMVRLLNLTKPDLYAKLIERANPTFVEPKAYMHVGFSRLRLGFENMPTHGEIRDFAVQLGTETGYNLLDEAPESRVVLLSRLTKPIKYT